MAAARFCLCVLALLGALLDHLRGGGTPGRAEGSARFRAPPERGAGAHVLAHACIRLEPRSAAHPATSSSLRRAGRSTAARSFWSNVSADAGSGQSCRQRSRRSATCRRGGVGGRRALPHGDITMRIAPIQDPRDSRSNLALPWFTGKPFALYAHVRAVTARRCDAPGAGPSASTFAGTTTPVPHDRASPGSSAGRPSRAPPATTSGTRTSGSVVARRTPTSPTMRELYTFHLEASWWQIVRWRVRAGAAGPRCPSERPARQSPTGPGARSTPPRTRPSSSGKLQPARCRLRRGEHRARRAASHSAHAGHDVRRRHRRRRARSTGSSVRTPSPTATASTSSSAARSSAAPRTHHASSWPAQAPRRTTRSSTSATRGDPPERRESKTAKTYMADGTPVIGERDAARGRNRAARRPSGRRHARPPATSGRSCRSASLLDESGAFEYYDAESPQDACESGRIGDASARTRGRRSPPAVPPFVSGLSPKGRLLAQAGRRPVVYSTPLVAWRPVVGASGVRGRSGRGRSTRGVSRGSSFTFARRRPSSQLDRRRWYYRVRGLNAAQVGTPAMAWSAPVASRSSARRSASPAGSHARVEASEPRPRARTSPGRRSGCDLAAALPLRPRSRGEAGPHPRDRGGSCGRGRAAQDPGAGATRRRRPRRGAGRRGLAARAAGSSTRSTGRGTTRAESRSGRPSSRSRWTAWCRSASSPLRRSRDAGGPSAEPASMRTESRSMSPPSRGSKTPCSRSRSRIACPTSHGARGTRAVSATSGRTC